MLCRAVNFKIMSEIIAIFERGSENEVLKKGMTTENSNTQILHLCCSEKEACDISRKVSTYNQVSFSCDHTIHMNCDLNIEEGECVTVNISNSESGSPLNEQLELKEERCQKNIAFEELMVTKQRLIKNQK